MTFTEGDGAGTICSVKPLSIVSLGATALLSLTFAACGGGGTVTIPDMGANADEGASLLGCAGLSKCINGCDTSIADHTSVAFNTCVNNCIARATPNAYNLLATAVFYCPAEEFCRFAPDGGTPACSADDVDPTKKAAASCKACVANVTQAQAQDRCANAIHDCTVNGP